MSERQIVIETPGTDAVAAEHAAMATDVRAIVVECETTHGAALGWLKKIAEATRRVEALFAPAKKAAHAAHKAIVAAEAELLSPLAEARATLTRAVGVYEADQWRIADEERRRLESVARQREEERRLMDAVAADQAGDAALAAEIMDEAPAPSPIVRVEPRVAKVSGVASVERWHAEVADKAALVAYVAAHPEWLSLVEPNAAGLNALARSQRGELRIPGVRAVSERSVSVRAS